MPGQKRLTIAEMPASKRKKEVSTVQFNTNKDKENEPPLDDSIHGSKRRRISVDKSVIFNTSSDLLIQP